MNSPRMIGVLSRRIQQQGMAATASGMIPNQNMPSDRGCEDRKLRPANITRILARFQAGDDDMLANQNIDQQNFEFRRFTASSKNWGISPQMEFSANGELLDSVGLYLKMRIDSRQHFFGG